MSWLLHLWMPCSRSWLISPCVVLAPAPAFAATDAEIVHPNRLLPSLRAATRSELPTRRPPHCYG